MDMAVEQPQPHPPAAEAASFSIEAAVDSYVASLEEERQPDGHWHPSSLFGCARKAVYDFLGVEKAPLDARTKRVFRIGHIFHEFIQTAIGLDPRFEVFYPEVKIVDPERRLKGHADGLGRLRDGRWVVVELKSIRSIAMKYGDLPKDDHRKQVAAYVSVLRKFGGLIEIVGNEELPNLERRVDYNPDTGETRVYGVIPPLGDLVDVLFAYASKDNLEIQEYWQVHTDQKEAWLDGYLQTLERHVADQTLPKRLAKLTDTGRVSKQRHYLCGYCPFAAKCWDASEPEGVD